MIQKIPKAQIQMLRLLINNVRISLPLRYVVKVFPLMMLEAVPGSPHYVVGLLNLAGKNIPVIDLAVRLGLERNTAYSLTMPVILCAKDSQETALLVDSILDLADVCEDSLQLNKKFDKPSSPFLGTVVIENETSLYLNVDKILELHLTSENQDQPLHFNFAEAGQYECENK